ncbi:ABC transporter ATP-binding protein [Achromobacter xylosoxidans]|uniref:ABC transporter ATP-binding protein n=1 Tax=Alcaligenes xylosoxydans xylosoxydans TaxID=85698 RepID=UPI00211AFEA3|nr:ABC transporter ATP-binding protein [Achromobacter xylosoxidans]
MPPLIRLESICQSYFVGEEKIVALNSVSLEVAAGQTCALLGASGSGKSTLLNIIGLLDRPRSGSFIFRGRDMTEASEIERSYFRNREIGFVFQSFNLLPRLTALDNVALPLAYRGVGSAEARLRAMEQLKMVGLGNRAAHVPADLSGGQRQRVAIARALVGEPSVILADEPTGNLDSDSTSDILSLLLSLNTEREVTLVVVTHDVTLAACFGRRLYVENGQLLEFESLEKRGRG